MKYEVFLSYRRKDSSERAELVKAILLKHGYEADSVFMDTHSLRGGDYQSKITDAIENSNNVVVLISRESFSIEKENDVWIYEIAKAIELKKNIIPVLFDGIQSFEELSLPSAISNLPINNAISYNHEYADAFYDKLLSFLVDEGLEDEEIPIKHRVSTTLKSILFILLIAIGAFLLFFSVGAIVGYFSTRENPKEAVRNAIHDKKLSIIDKQTIRYNGDLTSFDFNVETGAPKFIKGDPSIFESVTIERVVASASFPVLFSKLFKTASHGGNGKTRVFYVIGGTIGIACGYGVGHGFGELYSIKENEKAIYGEFYKEENRLLLKEYINSVIQ